MQIFGESEDRGHKLTWPGGEPQGLRRMAQCFACTLVFPIPIEKMIGRDGGAARLDEALADLECPVCEARVFGVTMVKV
jgi:hypothetical protein